VNEDLHLIQEPTFSDLSSIDISLLLHNLKHSRRCSIRRTFWKSCESQCSLSWSHLARLEDLFAKLSLKEKTFVMLVEMK
jgi:hypothetical protein